MDEKPLSKMYHEGSKKITRLFPSDDRTWPETWKQVEYKVYERLPKIILPRETLSFDLSKALTTRESKRDFSRLPLSLTEVSTLLRYAVGVWKKPGDIEPATRRTYPSGGGLYPVEVYLLVRRGTEELPAGLYHYNFNDHSLSVLVTGLFEQVEKPGFFNYSFADAAPLALFMTSVFERQYQKYGERSYRFALLEAGHISQNVYLVAAALGLHCCAIGGVRGGDTEVEKILDIDGHYESLIHSMLLGK